MSRQEVIWIVVGVVVTALLIVFALKYAVKRQVWLDSHCQKIGEVSGSSGVGTGITGNGNVAVVSVYTPGKTGYKCDDGLEYWE